MEKRIVAVAAGAALLAATVALADMAPGPGEAPACLLEVMPALESTGGLAVFAPRAAGGIEWSRATAPFSTFTTVRTIGSEDTEVFESWAFSSGTRALITKHKSNDDAGLVVEMIDVSSTGDPRVVIPALNGDGGRDIAVAFGAPAQTRVGWITGGTTLHVARDPLDSTSAWTVETLEIPAPGPLALVDGTWTGEDIAPNPGGYAAAIHAFSENALLVVSTLDEPGGFPLHYVHRNGSVWESEIATDAEYPRGVSIAGGDASPTIAFGIDAIFLATRTGGVWSSSSTPLAEFGEFTDCESGDDGGACGCSLRERPRQALGALLLAMLLPAVFVLRRR